jgi:putrescine transport system substrate-binding protein
MNFRRTKLVLCVASALLANVAGAAEVNVNHWSEFLATGTVEDFQAETNIKVNFSVSESLDTLQTKLIVGGAGYDVATPSHMIADRLLKSGLLHKIDKDKIPNLKNLDPNVLVKLREVDPGNDYMVPFAITSTILAYNETKVKELLGEDVELNSLALLFDPANAEKLKGCNISLLDTPASVFPMALTYLGLDPNSTKPKDYQAAFEALKAIRPFVSQFNEGTYINDMAGGEICLATVYGTDAMVARDRAEEAQKPFKIGYSVMKEGAATDYAVLVIPKDAPHPEEAMAWINFLLDPTVSAKNTNELRIATGNTAAHELVNAALLSDPVVSMKSSESSNFYMSKTVSSAIMKLENRLWNQLKLGQ